MSQLYNPPDVDEAHAEYNATCGPCALAALLGKTVTETMLKGFGPRFPGWCGRSAMEVALGELGAVYRWKPNAWPSRGLCWVTLEGPWRAPHLPAGARLSKSHWVAVNGDHVWDVNLRMWMHNHAWTLEVMQPWVEETKRCTGWGLIAGVEVAK